LADRTPENDVELTVEEIDELPDELAELGYVEQVVDDHGRPEYRNGKPVYAITAAGEG
jgi:hypothetical protein